MRGPFSAPITPLGGPFCTPVHIPRRVFLDTNVLNTLVKHSEAVFEQAGLPLGLDETALSDVEALMHVFHFGVRGPWEMLASNKSLSEIAATADEALRDELMEYSISFVGPPSEDTWFADNFGRRLADTHFVAALPDAGDRELLGNAIAHGCDVFCTRDRRTIVRKRDQLRSLPIRILTPAEWWAHVKPWGALWG